MNKVLTIVSAVLILVSYSQLVLLEETSPVPTPEEYYTTVLELHQKYHELDRAMLLLTEENPMTALVEESIKPLKSRISDLSKQIKAAHALTGTEASETFIKLQASYHIITNGLAELDIKLTDFQAEAEEKKDNFTVKIELLLGELRKAEELQKKLNLGEALDSLYGGAEFDVSKMNVSTLIEAQVLKMSLGLIKDIPGVLKQLKEENGEDITLDEDLSQAEQEDQLTHRIMMKKNEGLTPSALIPKMAQTVDEINEYFQAKISENIDIMGEEFSEHSKKLTSYWNQIQGKLDGLEEHLKGDLEQYMGQEKEGSDSRDEL